MSESIIWTSAKARARQLLGPRYPWLQRCKKELKWWYHARRLERFANRHQGQRCFIIGNGPSLNRMDLRPLANEFTFGLNRIYLLFDKVGFVSTYYVSVNRLVIGQCASEIQGLPAIKFIDWVGQKWMHSGPNLFFIRRIPEPCFVPDIRRGLWQGATVTYVAMQIAYYMGFTKVILIGVDHSFVTPGKPGTTVISQGDDPNHFDPSYFGKGFQWQLPDLETSELAYRIAKYKFERANREIVDATIDGRLQVFPKVDYPTLFA